MAKVVGPLNSVEARGLVGALVYNTWRGINYVKSTQKPKTEYSADQVALRLLTANATLAWQAASDLERANWLDYANAHPDTDWTGSPKRITAYNWFVRINVRRQQLNMPVSAGPPSFSTSNLIWDFTVTSSCAEIDVLWTVDVPEEDDHTCYIFYLVGPHSPGASPSVKMAKYNGWELAVSGYHTIYPTENGSYTVYARPADLNGTVGPWYKGTVSYIAEE
jgi:hypothetical protein